MAGDQQAALVGQGCFAAGEAKSTYGTGCFVLVHTGGKPLLSRNRLLTTVAYRVCGESCFALEGSIFSAGSTVQWLRDGLGIIDDAARSGELAAAANDRLEIYLVPAFTGLGAPHWNPHARAAILGITRDTTRNEICRAALEAVAFQTADLLDAIAQDGAPAIPVLRVDGGMAKSDWTMQRVADYCGLPVERPKGVETTARGAAWLAGLGVGLFGSFDELAGLREVERRFVPAIGADERARRRAGWRDAVSRVKSR